MKAIELAQQSLRDAADVPGALAAGWAAFELVRVTADAAASPEAWPDMFPAFMFTRGAAVAGRNALGFAPSMPAGSAVLAERAEPGSGDVQLAADAIASLASALSARLGEAAQHAADTGDRAACETAALEARRIIELLRAGQ